MKLKLIGISAFAILLAIVGVQLSKRVPKRDILAARLAEGIMNARSSLPKFRVRLEHPLHSDRSFFIRAEFKSDGNRTEYLWLNHVQPSDGGYTAVVAEAPVLTQKIFQGQDVVIPEANVVDWTIKHQDGSQEGGFTQGLEPNVH